MAGGLMGPGNGRKRYKPMAEINVTPLVDVMLVLLIIFMITAPMITSSVNVNLPNANAKPMPNPSKPITISIDAKGLAYINNNSTPVEISNLVATLQAASQNDPNQTIIVRGDKDANYGVIMQVMAAISSGGFTKISLLAQPGNQ